MSKNAIGLVRQLQMQIFSFTRTWSFGHIQIIQIHCVPLTIAIEYIWFLFFFFNYYSLLAEKPATTFLWKAKLISFPETQ